MFNDTLQFYSAAKQSVGHGDSSRRLAMGVAIGLLIGLIPKASLLAWVFGVLLMISTANLLTAFICGIAASWIAVFLDGFTHRLGAIVLTDSRLEPTWTWLYEMPIIPWTLFNNTIVMGSLLIGLAMFIPVYLSSDSFFRTWGRAIGQSVFKRFGHTWIYRWLAPNPSALQRSDAA